MALDTRAAALTAWQIDPKHTTVGFSVKHMMFATVKGRFAGVSGTIVLDEANPARSSVEVEVDAASVDTREEQRDGHLRSPDFFRSTRVEPTSANAAEVHGDLTIRGVTRPIVFDATLLGRAKNPWGQEVAGFEVRGKVNRKEFGLNWNAALEAGGFLVGDEVNLEIDVEAVRQQ
jgi:polyisoprenoid-binding protein YceI